MLSAPARPHRGRHLITSLLASLGLTLGLMGAAVPATAAQATTSTTAGVLAPTVTTRGATVHGTTMTAVTTAARRTTALSMAARVAGIRATAVRIARSRVGSGYSAGAAGPHWFDCSGLALYVVRLATGRNLPHYSRAQFAATARVSRKNLKPGDLVFFFGRGAHHVGIYIGNGLMVNATSPRGGVRIDAVFSGWYGSRYSGAGRLL